VVRLNLKSELNSLNFVQYMISVKTCQFISALYKKSSAKH